MRIVTTKKVVAIGRGGRDKGKKLVSEQLIIIGKSPVVREIISHRGKTS